MSRPEDIQSHIFYLVDDDRVERLMLDRTIRKLEPDSVTRSFGDGIELIEFLVTHSESPDLVFLDIHMPVADGKTTLKLLKKDRFFQTIPIVVLTKKTDLYEREKVLMLGAHAYYNKPDSMNELEEIVRKVRQDILCF